METIKYSTLINEEKLQERLVELGKQIQEDYQGKDLVCVCLLNGAFMFFSDLIRNIDMDFKCDFLGLSSYVGTSSTGEVKITLDISQSIKEKHVLLIEDIVDTGNTMKSVYQLLETRSPASIKTATLLDKPSSDSQGFKADYVGFSINSEFVVGYGLDYNQRLRTLPYIAQVDNIN